MIQIDLITGFLGSGKTTFIKKYAGYLMQHGLSIGILENDFGAVNVDAMLLQDILGEHCTLEMVSGGCDADCHRRRFKTKLIAMGMSGYDRVLVEPSGIFDMDEFFDVLHEDPLERWYTIGNVITIVDAGLEFSLSDASEYLLISQASKAGTLLYSHTQEVPPAQLTAVQQYLNGLYDKFHCERSPYQTVLTKDWTYLTDADFAGILSSGYFAAEMPKLWFDSRETYDSLYFMNLPLSVTYLKESGQKILNDPSCGRVFRIKGFCRQTDGQWFSINMTKQTMCVEPIVNGQAILIVIGEGLHQDAIEAYWEPSRPTPDNET